MTLFLTTSKICSIRAKKTNLRRKKCLGIFLARNFFSAEDIFSVDIILFAKKYNLYKNIPHLKTIQDPGLVLFGTSIWHH